MVNFHDAKTADAFDREVVTRMGLPSWNWVFSDTRGHIGYRMNGRINARGTQLPFGTQKVDQLPPEAEFLAPDSLPHERDPSRGFIASANNIALPSTTPWDGGRGYRSGLRAFRIEELLQKERAHSLDTLRAIQCDVQVIDQRFLLPLLIKHVEQTASRGSIPRLISDLRIWDGNATPGCTVCGLYRRWVDLLRERLQVNLVALYRLLALQNTPIHLNEIIAETLQAAFDQTRAQPWSILHIAPFPHISNERQLLDHSPVPSPGDAESVNLGRGEWRGTAYEHTEGPSQRMIIEMARTPKIWLGFAGRNLYALSDTQANPIDWQSWAQCEIAPVAFPFDWSKKGLTFYSVSQLY
jgi:hypothetical protein